LIELIYTNELSYAAETIVMNFEYKIKSCPICKQGWVEIVKDQDSKKLFLCCSECETEWLNPEEITSKNGTHDTFGRIETPLPTEIIKKKWESFLITPISKFE
jgi:hypothetical protein